MDKGDAGRLPFPRRLWLYWGQGMERAPFLVRRCVESWLRENQGWDVTVLDEEAATRTVGWDLPPQRLARLDQTKRSNLLRLRLLAEHGGVWADATTYCMRPLEAWLPACGASGFFAFRRPGPDRLLSNWFLAAVPASPLVERWRQEQAALFSGTTFNNEGAFKRAVLRALGRALNRSARTTGLWFSPPLARLLRVHPYFVCHYLFGRVVARDATCRRIWDLTPELSADAPHRIQLYGLLAPLSPRLRREIDAKACPLYKLTWKRDLARYAPGTALHYLLEGRSAVA